MKPRAVHQFLQTFSAGDAIGNCAWHLRSCLRSWGFVSEIYAVRIDAPPSEGVLERGAWTGAEDAAVILHHSTETDLVDVIAQHRGRKAVVYHNITPRRFFEQWNPVTAHEMDRGLEQLEDLARVCELALGVSPFNCAELQQAGFRQVRELPLPVGRDALSVAPDTRLLRKLDDGRTNLLFVGRMLPHKRPDDLVRLVRAFRDRHSDDIRLVLAGATSPTDAFGAYLSSVIARLAPENVLQLGKVSASELSACYAAAHLFVSMSEHEGFAAPLIEAMARGVPVLAFGAGAVPDTVGDG